MTSGTLESAPFDYAGQSFETEAARCRCIAMEWLTAGSLNDSETINFWLDTVRPESLVSECIDGWFSRDDDQTLRPDLDVLTVEFLGLAGNRAWLDL